jgi:23S rRNA (adenine2503-C2)-methyltransferase
MSLLKDEKSHFLGMLPAEFDAQVKNWGWPAFRAEQIRQWVYSRQIVTPDEMSNLTKQQRSILSRQLDFTPSNIASHQSSADGTIKLLLAWSDGAQAETVMIPDGNRRTACVSSQVGCPVGCRFCASGINGVKGNLSAGQIVEQVYRLNQILAGGTNGEGNDSRPAGRESTIASGDGTLSLRLPRISNIVFMGMGEPLSNYPNVMRAIRILNHPDCLGLGARRITLSTVGVPPRIRQLAEEDLPINLALSLHAPNEALRRQLIPWAEHFALPDILDACRYYFDKTGREITLEYILLSGINDRPEHARELARLCRTLRSNVNLIRYNEVSGLPFRRPLADDVVIFQEILREQGINAHVRKSRGRDIDAACGQLRRNELKKSASLIV